MADKEDWLYTCVEELLAVPTTTEAVQVEIEESSYTAAGCNEADLMVEAD